MSRAFVKEDGPTRWEPDVRYAYQVRAVGETEIVMQSDNLLGLLQWLETREPGRYELRDESGLLLAHS